MTTYTVIDYNGYKIDGGLTAAEAAHIVLTYDGRDYEIRENEDGGYTLWSRHPVANRGWEPTVVESRETNRDAAENEIMEVAIESEWPRRPLVMTDENYASILAERLADLEE